MKTFKKEKLGFSISNRFNITMDAFVENGINYLEVRLLHGNDKELMQSFISEALREKQRLGFKIRTLHLPQLADHDLSSLDEDVRLKAIEKQKALVEMGMCLEPEVLVLHPDVGRTEEKDWHLRHKALKESLKDFAPWCKEKGLKIALENLTQISAFQKSEFLLDVINSVDSDNIGICLDVNHLFLESHKDFIKNAGKHIITMHISDYDGINEKHHVPGKGVINWKELLSLLDEIGYDHTLIFECAGVIGVDGFPQTVVDLKQRWQEFHK